jgi:CheY-like chemotaxis protein/nitrogen-specific signal transduction histidine kinase
VSVSDITNLVRATDEARTASQAKSRFLANMSHEIRTPMNAVIGMLALLQRTELTEQQVDYAQKANRSARSLLRLLDDILDFSKIEAGKLALELREFSLDGLLQELAVILDVMAQGKAFRVMFDIDPCLPDRLVGDAMRLQQILVNLAANAVKFTERGEITLRLALQGESAGRATLALSVQDTGIGIAAENLPLVFGAFTQAEASTTRRFGGTGLGLSICRHLARMMDSELLLESRLGQGSRFHFTLSLPVPANTQRTSIAGRHDVSRLAREPHPAQPVPVSSAARLAGLRVLVAEDNATNRQVVQELLALEGAIVTLVNDGQDAVNLLARRPLAEPDFDVVLMDLQMPVMDGITATRRIRDISHLARLPVVAMTANVLETERKACLDAGMNAHVGKPFDLDHLVDVLRTQAGVVSPASAQAVTPIICAATAAPLRELTSKARACGGMGGHASAACGQVQAGQTCSSISIASAAGVDMSEAVQRVGDRCDVYARMLEAFMADLDDLQAALTLPATALARKNQARAAHTLKGAAAMVGATRLSAAAADAERVLNADGAKDLCALSLGRVCQMLDECRPGLRALLASLHERGPSLDAPHHATRLDRSALRDAMVGLSEQLRHFDMGAVETMSRLQTEFCTAGQWLSPVNDAITMLDFDRAALLCDKVLQEPLA